MRILPGVGVLQRRTVQVLADGLLYDVTGYGGEIVIP